MGKAWRAHGFVTTFLFDWTIISGYELFTGQQSAAHQAIFVKVVIRYNDPLVLRTVQDSS